MKCLYIIILFAGISQVYQVQGMMRHSVTLLAGSAWLSKVYEKSISLMLKKPECVTNDLSHESFHCSDSSRQKAHYQPFDRHTAVRILQERREQGYQNRK